MPNPPRHPSRFDMPLDAAMDYATHIRIKCMPPTFARACSRSDVWRTSDLVEKLPNCRTLGEFKAKLYCRKCKWRGWVSIEPEGR